MLSYWLQPFDEATLADMPFADRLQPAGEVATRPSLFGNCLEVEQKTGGRIVAGSVTRTRRKSTARKAALARIARTGQGEIVEQASSARTDAD
jgi:hypothetical protein